MIQNITRVNDTTLNLEVSTDTGTIAVFDGYVDLMILSTLIANIDFDQLTEMNPSLSASIGQDRYDQFVADFIGPLLKAKLIDEDLEPTKLFVLRAANEDVAARWPRNELNADLIDKLKLDLRVEEEVVARLAANNTQR